jgi:hypothetical protein
MKSESKIPCIPKQGVMSFGWRDAGRAASPAISWHRKSFAVKPAQATVGCAPSSTANADCLLHGQKSCKGV